jgi:hypothetical protein
MLDSIDLRMTKIQHAEEITSPGARSCCWISSLVLLAGERRRRWSMGLPVGAAAPSSGVTRDHR